MNIRLTSAALALATLTLVACSISAPAEEPTGPTGTPPAAEEPMGKKPPQEPIVGEDGEIRDPMMVGLWTSDEDANFTVNYGADGSIVAGYANDPTATLAGVWRVIDPTTEDTGVPADSLAGMTVIRIDYPKATPVYLGIKGITETSLTTVDLSGAGKVASFTKVM